MLRLNPLLLPISRKIGSIQIQPILRLNICKNLQLGMVPTIQIQPMLRLNRYSINLNNNAIVIQIQPMLRLNFIYV